MHPSYADSVANFALTQTSSGIGGTTIINSPSDVRMAIQNSIYLRCISNNIYHFKSVVSSSDARLKLNQRSIVGALATLSAMQPKNYEKRDSLDDIAPPTVTESGFVAQEVNEIPELAHIVSHPTEANMTWGLDYQQISAYTVAGIQELISKVEALTARVAALES